MARQKLVTKEILRQLPPLYSTEDVPTPYKVAVVKFFLGGKTWFGVEFDPDNQTFFGLIVDRRQGNELGYFSLRDLESLRFMERDAYFRPKRLGDLVPGRDY